MSVKKLTFEQAVAIGKMVCPPKWELGEVSHVPSLENISNQLGIRLNTLKRWIAESVFVEELPQKAIITEDFQESDGWEPLEILAFYVWARLGVRWVE